MFFRDRKRWLRHQVNETLKSEYPVLMGRQRRLYTECIWYLMGRNRWWLIVLLVFGGIYLSALINNGLLASITLEPKTAATLVDQRSSNLATIISISLVVVGFMINNLAIKEPVVYKLLFRRSSLYLVMYLTLSTIAVFIITSTLRDTLHEEYFSKVVLSASYALILILVLIGALFRNVVMITDPKRLNAMLQDEVRHESVIALRSFLFWKQGQKRIQEFMSTNNIQDRGLLVSLGTRNNLKIDTNLPERVLHDIHFQKLEVFLQKNPGAIHVTNSKYSLGSMIRQPDEFVWDNNSRTPAEDRKDLEKCVQLKKPSNSPDNFRSYFDAKFEDLVASGKHRDLGTLMDTYLDLYEMEMINRITL